MEHDLNLGRCFDEIKYVWGHSRMRSTIFFLLPLPHCYPRGVRADGEGDDSGCNIANSSEGAGTGKIKTIGMSSGHCTPFLGQKKYEKVSDKKVSPSL